MPEDRFHLKLPPCVNYPFYAPVAGPSGTHNDDNANEEMLVVDNQEDAQSGDKSREVQG